jgi:hypothetical protein
MLRHSSRMRELNDSMQPLRQGYPAGIKCRPISPAGQSAIVLQANSGPLSQRRTAGKAPRSADKRSNSLPSALQQVTDLTDAQKWKVVCGNAMCIHDLGGGRRHFVGNRKRSTSPRPARRHVMHHLSSSTTTESLASSSTRSGNPASVPAMSSTPPACGRVHRLCRWESGRRTSSTR